MLDFGAALNQVLAEVPLLGTERIACRDALNRVLREPLKAREPIPRFDASAMDGYAIRFDDYESRVELPVVGEARTGQAPSELPPRTAMRIFTGGALPHGADTVIMQERVCRSATGIVIESVPNKGDHVRHAGEDLLPGAVALAGGSRISAGALMLAAALDLEDVFVSLQPRVTILCTGDELRAVATKGSIGTIPESNSQGLRALALQAGAAVSLMPPVADVPEILTGALSAALQRSDALVTVGGVSVGEHDYVKQALEGLGSHFDFWKVAIKPGKPIAFARHERCRILALPGNPASALITFGLFAMPLLRAMQGDRRPVACRYSTVCGTTLRRHPDRLVLVLGHVINRDGQSVFVPHDNQSSGATTALALSDGIAFVEAGEGDYEAGSSIEFLPWSQL